MTTAGLATALSAEDAPISSVAVALPEERRRIKELLAKHPRHRETKVEKLLRALGVLWRQNPQEKMVVFATYLGSVEMLGTEIENQYPGQGVTAVPGYGVNEPATSHLFSIGHTWFLTPSSLNEFRFGFTRVTSLTVNQAGPQADTYGFNTGWPANSPLNLGNIPNITFSGGFVSGVSPISKLGGTGNNHSKIRYGIANG